MVDKRQKVSLAAALWMPPQRDRLGLFYRELVNAHFHNIQVAVFLEDFLTHHKGRWVVVWDGGPMHKGDPIRELLDRLSLERLPPYASMLNPVEFVWGWLKYARLSNFAPHDVTELHQAAIRELQMIERNQTTLQKLFRASELPLPRTLLFWRVIDASKTASKVQSRQDSRSARPGKPSREYAGWYLFIPCSFQHSLAAGKHPGTFCKLPRPWVIRPLQTSGRLQG